MTFAPRLRPAAWILAAALSACAPAMPPPLPAAPVPAGPQLRLTVEPVALDAADPSRTQVDGFAYAGGLVITSGDTARLHGLSDLEIDADGRLTAVSDEGDLFQARLALGADGRLTGLTDGAMTPLVGLDGGPLQGKGESDSEGLAVMPNGDRLISFERDSRIWLHPAAGGPPRAVPSPEAVFPENSGMEALGPDPAAGADAYIVGGEDSGELWTCRISSACAPAGKVEKPAEFGLVAVRRLPQGRTAYLLRAWDPLRGSRIVLRIDGPRGEIDLLTLARPLTVDNFEGLAAAPMTHGLRFYLLSDDNFQSSQRTLLLAFDWTPKPEARP